MKKSYLNHEHKKIAEWLKKLTFRKQIFGGICEQDVWEKIEVLNEMYEAALSAERARYDVLLEEQKKAFYLSQKKSKSTHLKRKTDDD